MPSWITQRPCAMSHPKRADLHTHSHFSDGTSSPAEVVGLAAQLQLGAVALTDHDTVAGLAQAEEEARRLDVCFIPGIELTADHSETERHILGYWIDPGSPELASLLERMERERRGRVGRIAEKLGECGVALDPEEVFEVPHQGVLGRMHVAEALCRRGATANVNEAFARYLRDDGPAYVPKYALTVAETIALIHRAGGVASLAHPGGEVDREEITGFAQAGLDGLEAYYPGYASSLRDRYCELARHLSLVATGGSDYHGRRKDQGLGAMTVPLEAVERLKARLPTGSGRSL